MRKQIRLASLVVALLILGAAASQAAVVRVYVPGVRVAVHPAHFVPVPARRVYVRTATFVPLVRPVYERTVPVRTGFVHVTYRRRCARPLRVVHVAWRHARRPVTVVEVVRHR